MRRSEIEAIAQKAHNEWRTMTDNDCIAREKGFLTALINAYAADGCFYLDLDNVYQENIKWLRKLGFEVTVNEEEQVRIRWCNNYNWRN